MAKSVMITYRQNPLQLSAACLALTTIAVCSTPEVTGMGKAHLRNAVWTQKKNSPEFYSLITGYETTDGCREMSTIF